MPTYEYECRSCRRRLEVSQRIADPPLTVCEECGGSLRKLFHPVGIAFKGSGFYVTDNRSSRSSSNGKKDEPAKKDAAKKDAPKEQGTKPSSKEKSA